MDGFDIIAEMAIAEFVRQHPDAEERTFIAEALKDWQEQGDKDRLGLVFRALMVSLAGENVWIETRWMAATLRNSRRVGYRVAEMGEMFMNASGGTVDCIQPTKEPVWILERKGHAVAA